MKFRGKVLKVKLVFVSMVVLLAKKSKSKQVIRDETTGTTVQHWSKRNLFRVLARCVNKNKNQFDESKKFGLYLKDYKQVLASQSLPSSLDLKKY